MPWQAMQSRAVLSFAAAALPSFDQTSISVNLKRNVRRADNAKIDVNPEGMRPVGVCRLLLDQEKRG